MSDLSINLCLVFEKKIFKEIYDLYGHTLAQERPIRRIMTFIILLDPSLVIINMQLECLSHATEKRREITKDIMHFHYMTYGLFLAQEPLPLSYEIYNFGRPLLGLHSSSGLSLGVQEEIYYLFL